MFRNDVCAIFYDNHEYNKLLPLTEQRSIASLPFDCKYRMMDFILSMVKNADIHDILMILNENKMSSLIDHIGSGREWGLDSAGNYYYFLFIQEILRKKSSGEMYLDMVIQYLKDSKSKYTVLMGNKFLYNLNLKNLIQSHIARGCQVTAVYQKVKFEKFAKDDRLLIFDKNRRIKRYIENVPGGEEVNNLEMEVFIINTDWLINLLRMGQNEGISSDLEKLVMDEMIKSSNFGYEYTGFLSDIYDILSYYQANMKMLNVNDFNKLIFNFQKVNSRASQNVPTYLGKSSKIYNSQLSSGCNIDGIINNSLLSSKVKVGLNSKVKDAILYSNVKVGEHVIIKNAILDKNVIVRDGISIIGSRHHPIVIGKGAIVNNDRITSK